jgi:heme/copper-type cytochrome/quinol oxidase subunit 4
MSAPPSGFLLVVTFVVLEGLAVLNWAVSAAGAPTAVLLAIAMVQAIVSGFVFMELKSAHPAFRVIAVVVVFFIVLLCTGVAGDVSMRG